MAKDVVGNTKLADRIRQKYALKNTTSYALNSLVDYEDPIDIVAHLIVGSEGILGFLDEIRMYICVDHPNKASVFVPFPDLSPAGLCTAALKKEPVYVVEIMDNVCVQSVADEPGMPAVAKTLKGDESALLIETRSGNPEELERQIVWLEEVPKEFETINSPRTLCFVHSGGTSARDGSRLWLLYVSPGLV